MFVVRPVIWHFLWWALLAPLLLIEFTALHTLQETLALRDPARAQTAIAEAELQRDSGREPVVRYRFKVPGDQTWYSASDMIGRRELWTPLTPDAATQARRGGQISVTYLPENPWANQPVGRAGNPVVDSFAFWAMFLLIDLVWLAETLAIARNYLRCLHAAERREIMRFRFWRSARS